MPKHLSSLSRLCVDSAIKHTVGIPSESDGIVVGVGGGVVIVIVVVVVFVVLVVVVVVVVANPVTKHQIKSNFSLYSLDYAKASNELAGPFSASLRLGNTAPFKEISQGWRDVGNTVSDLTSPRFEPQTSRSSDKRVTARTPGLL